MLTSVATGPRGLGLLWHAVRALLHLPRAVGTSSDPAGVDTKGLTVTRLRDLGFERDQMSGSVDFAKGQHQRFF